MAERLLGTVDDRKQQLVLDSGRPPHGSGNAAIGRWEKGEQFAFIIHSATGEGLGWIDLQLQRPRRGNVSYGVIERHRGKGAATRGVLLATQYAFDVLHWVRLEIVMIADNAASRAVALKAGFRHEGVLRSYGAFEKYEPELGRRFDWAIYGPALHGSLTAAGFSRAVAVKCSDHH